ncbi:coiled-coil domain-containing protein [Adhaeribacter rhizoryzae]|uniref:Uncharacterized protein n=1 Tax=Adhaeribacter rhizoryzae TaxID=2607907 RepID=A0A5M6D3A9_9BACT|nr:hypothetical protein [Adhaeribacter rhizoryzae]KAA5541971.1 hypothetical protein F0145_19480 [Adhaeribacter rhizoryzae]
MQNLKFNQLLLLSNSEKSGNVFQFQTNLNLITAAENNVGKSTLVKLLFWALGCELGFDTTWKNLDCKALVKFQIGDIKYQIMRYKDLISFKEGDSATINYPKITGAYAQKFAEIVDFKALLPNREDTLEVPPPAYYFLPYYIDQKKSWASPWDSFENLQQYADWKQTIVKYHVGIYKPQHFEIETDKYHQKTLQRVLVEDIKKIDIALSIVDTYVPKLSTVATTDENKFNLMTAEIRQELVSLASRQEVILDKLAKTESEKAYLEHQKVIAEGVITELELDYKFSVENLEDDNVECPLCGTIHQNTAIERAAILVDKQQAESQLTQINISLSKLNDNLFKINSQLDEARTEIADLKNKYVVEDEKQEKVGLTTIIESIAGKSIQEKVIENRTEKLVEQDTIEKELKALIKEQKDIQSKELIEEIKSYFNETFINYAKLLNTEEVNLSAINSPLDYNKVVKEGGAAENVRVTLAYNLAIYSVVEKYSNGTRSAFIIDTPNQHEQSDTNYDSIINLILNTFPKDAQIILCAMDNEHLKPYQQKAHVIRLTDKKLLDTNQYEMVKTEFDKF